MLWDHSFTIAGDIIIESSVLLLGLLILFMAVLYSSVGHGGASGYVAAMALFSLPADIMRPTALMMNIVVTLWLLTRLNEHRTWAIKTFWPLVAISAPAAFVGGLLPLSNKDYLLLVALLLVLSGMRMLFQSPQVLVSKPVARHWLLLAGGLLGLLSGMTGVGGGIFLSPVLLIWGWATMRQSTVVAALFILVNSCFGLAGYFVSHTADNLEYTGLIPLALIGAFIGAELARQWTTPQVLQRLLGIVLMIASAKIIHLGLS